MTRRVLIVDDNDALAEDLAEILEDSGYETLVFTRGRDVLAQESLEFDAAVLDVRMPEIDGIALHQELARLHPEAVFVLMTAYTADDRIASALAAGVRAVLPKPVPLEQLFTILPPSGTSVLVVEDDQQLAAGLVESLSVSGYSCRLVNTLKDARRLWEAEKFEAAIVDLRLPDGDGSSFARVAGEKDAVVVLITGFDADEATQLLTKELDGRGSLLTKPFSPDVLLRTLSELRQDGT